MICDKASWSSEKLDALAAISVFYREANTLAGTLLGIYRQGRSASHVKSQYWLSIPLELSGGEPLLADSAR